MLMVEDNVGDQFRPNLMQNVGNQVVLNASQNPSVRNVRNQNGLGVLSKIPNQYRNGNVVTASDEGIQHNSEEFDFMAAAGAYDEMEKVNASCNSQDNLQQASTSGNYTKLLEPIHEPHQVQQNDSNVIFAVSNVEQSRGPVEQHPVNVEETRVIYDSLYNNLAIDVEKVNSKETTYGTSTNTKFAEQSILGKPHSSSRPKLYVVTPLPNSKAIPKIDESHALSKPVTSNSSWKVYSIICSMNYSNGETQVVSKSSVVTTADASDKHQQQQDSTLSTSTLATTITADGNFDM
nr:hypothetical protein [Tanacetum cinerariifolium]